MPQDPRLEDVLNQNQDPRLEDVLKSANQDPRLEDVLRQSDPSQNQGVAPWMAAAQQRIGQHEMQTGQPADNDYKAAALKQFQSAANQGQNYHTQNEGEMQTAVAQASAKTNTPMQNFGMPILQGEVTAGQNTLRAIHDVTGVDTDEMGSRSGEADAQSKYLASDPNAMATKAGNAADFGIQMAPMLAPGYGQVYGALQGASNVGNEADVARSEGKTVSTGSEVADMALQGAAMAAMGPISRGVGGIAGKAIGKLAGGLLGTAVAGGAAQVGNNAADKYTGIDPNRDLSAGVAPAMLGGALAHGLTHLTNAHAPAPEATTYTPEEHAQIASRLRPQGTDTTVPFTADEKSVMAARISDGYTPDQKQQISDRLSPGDTYNAGERNQLRDRMGNPATDNPPTVQKPTAADHEMIRQASAVHEQTMRRNSGVDQLSALNDKATQINADAAGGNPKDFSTAKGVADWASNHDPDVKDSRFDEKTANTTSDYFHGELKNLDNGHEKFVQADVPLDQLKLNPSYQKDVASSYAKQGADTSPPAIGGFKDGKMAVVDGNTRAYAAQERGESSIKMYVPESDAQKLNPQSNAKIEGAAKTAGSTVAPGSTGSTPPESQVKPSVFQRMQAHAKALASDEAGGLNAAEIKRQATNQPDPATGKTPFQDRSEIQGGAAASKKTFKGIRESYNTVNRFIGSGLDENTETRGVRTRWSAALGDLDRSKLQLETAMKPARDLMQGMSDKAKEQWVNTVEAGGPSPDPKMQDAANILRQQNNALEARAKAVGVDTSNWNGDWIGRVAEWPDAKGNFGKSSIAGTEDYLKGRKLDTFSDFKNAVEATGGRLKYSNPLDMYMAKNAEVDRSLTAREFVKDEQGRGTITVAPKTQLPEGFARLDDKIARGQMAPTEIAGKLNQIISPDAGGRGLPVLDSWIKLKRESASLNFALSGWHVTTTTMRNLGLSMGNAMESAANGEFGLAAKNLYRGINPAAQRAFGKSLIDAAAAAKPVPGLEPLVKAAQAGGAKFSQNSYVTSPSDFEKMHNAFAVGQNVTASVNAVKGVVHALTETIMNRYVQPMKVGLMGAQAELEIAKGNKNPDQLRDSMNHVAHTVDNVMGAISRDRQFQHRVATDIMDGLFAAPKFMEGDLRQGGQTVVDAGKMLGQMATGKMPKMTKTMYGSIGLVTGHAMISAAMQMAMTAIHNNGTPTLPTTLKDYFYPRTGRKNKDGTEERISLPDLGFVASELTSRGSVLRPLTSRVDPLLRAFADVATNSDYKNQAVRSGSLGKQIADSAKHIGGAAAVPFSVGQQVEKPTNGNAPPRIARFFGTTEAPSSVTKTPAMNAVEDYYDAHPVPQSETPADPDKPKKEREPGLVGMLGSRELNGSVIMRDIWPKMSSQEKQDSYQLVNHKLATSKTISSEARQRFYDQINKDVP